MRILVVEDEHIIAQSIKKGLEQEHFSVEIAYTGNEGYECARTEEFDAIILDVLLPGMNGLQIVQSLRALHIQTPILLLTAKGQLHEKISGFHSGADDYLTKPFAFEELLARIQALLRRPAQRTESVLTYGDLSLNTDTVEVKRAGKSIHLSSKEFALLEYLLRHKDHVMTKNQIIEHVWDYDADILPNTVEVYMGYLRTKIDKAFPELPSLIQTVRGFGYKIGTQK